MILAAYRNSPGTAHALIEELSHSQPVMLQRFIGGIPDMMPKAYRFDGEMEEIAAFVAEGETSKAQKAGVIANGHAAETSSAPIYQGLANTYRAVAKEIKEKGEDIEQLKDFVSSSKTVLENKEKAAKN